MSLTIPACLEVLGDPQDSDPAVRFADPEGFSWSWHPLDFTPNIGEGADDLRLLVEQSEPTLLRVLCRHLGWQGNYRPVMRLERRGHSNTRPVWVLRNLTKWHDAPMLDDGPNFYAELPDISTDLDYLEALAEAVVWYARVARSEQWRSDIVARHGITTTNQRDLVAAVEHHLNLPTWAVQR